MNLFAKHIPVETLIDLAEKEMATNEQTQTHLEQCDHCRKEFESVQRMLLALHQNELQNVPPFATARVLQLFKPLAKEQPKRLSLSTILKFDSGSNFAPAFGMRSGDQNNLRQMLFNAEQFDIDVRIESSGDQWLVSGQVLGSQDVGDVELIGFSDRFGSPINDLGEFFFSPIPAGKYQMLITLPGVDISVPNLTLGEMHR